MGFISFEHAVRFRETTRSDDKTECCDVIEQADLKENI